MLGFLLVISGSNARTWSNKGQTMSSAEHRTAGRTRSLLRGVIIHSNGNSRTECTVRDLSETGARMEISSAITVPEFFDLFIPLKNATHRSRIVWRNSTEIGATFEDVQRAPQAASPAAEVADDTPVEIKLRMLELELETAKLRAQLAEMRAVIDTFIVEKKSA